MNINKILYRFSGKYRLEIDSKLAEKRKMEREFREEFVRDFKSVGIEVSNHL